MSFRYGGDALQATNAQIARPFNPQQMQADQEKRLRQGERDASYGNMAHETALNSLRASNLATQQAAEMIKNQSNHRTVVGDRMTISSPADDPNGGSIGSSGSSVQRVPNPIIDGRYQQLVGNGAANFPTLDTSGIPSSSGSQPPVSLGPGSFTPQDATAFQDAAFGRLKAKSGELGKSAVDSLASTLAGRGISGHSGTFVRGVGDRIASAVQPLADLNVAHLGQEYGAANEARRLSENRAQAEYQGGITQRSQNIQAQQALDALKAQIALAKYQAEVEAWRARQAAGLGY